LPQLCITDSADQPARKVAGDPPEILLYISTVVQHHWLTFEHLFFIA